MITNEELDYIEGLIDRHGVAGVCNAMMTLAHHKAQFAKQKKEAEGESKMYYVAWESSWKYWTRTAGELFHIIPKVEEKDSAVQ